MNICEICGTENESKYKYCKNCGNLLNAQSETATAPQDFTAQQTVHFENTATDNMQNSFNNELNGVAGVQTTQSGAAYSNFGYFTLNDFSGISSEEMASFIGKKANKFLPKFSKMELSGSKISWCWPAAVLGYFFGPMGSALWFFYRKMYKPAFLFSAIGAVLTILTSVLDFNTGSQLSVDFSQITDFSSLISAVQESLKSTELSTSGLILSYLSPAISGFASLASCLISGMFGMNFYKNYCKKRIVEYRSFVADQRYYRIGLASVGGTSAGMLILGIALYFATNEIVSLLAIFFN